MDRGTGWRRGQGAGLGLGPGPGAQCKPDTYMAFYQCWGRRERDETRRGAGSSARGSPPGTLPLGTLRNVGRVPRAGRPGPPGRRGPGALCSHLGRPAPSVHRPPLLSWSSRVPGSAQTASADSMAPRRFKEKTSESTRGTSKRSAGRELCAGRVRLCPPEGHAGPGASTGLAGARGFCFFRV